MNRGNIKLAIDRCIAHDVPDAADMIESLRQQLSAALAACKLKDDALERIASINLAEYILPEDFAFRVLQVRKALAIQPDDSALKAWLGEPVAWMQISVEEGVSTKFPRMEKPSKYNHEWWMFEPLYSPKGLK